MIWKEGTGFPLIDKVYEQHFYSLKSELKEQKGFAWLNLLLLKMESLSLIGLLFLKKGKSKLVKKLQQWILDSELNC